MENVVNLSPILISLSWFWSLLIFKPIHDASGSEHHQQVHQSVLETPGIPVTGTPSINSPCHEDLFWVEECLLYVIDGDPSIKELW